MKIAIISGSISDKAIIDAAGDYVDYFNLDADIRVISAHRNPKELAAFITEFEEKGGEVIIGVAGMAAHLPGVIASHTTLPVLGVPVEGPSFKGMDSLLSIVQMPKGIPVATFAVGKAGMINAVIFSAQILSKKYPELIDKIKAFKDRGSAL